MRVLLFPLAEGEPPRLQLTWHGNMDDVQVLVDGQQIGWVPDEDAMLRGESFNLPDGGNLFVQLDPSTYRLVLLRNGRPLPSPQGDEAVARPRAMGRQGAAILAIIGLLDAGIGGVVSWVLGGQGLSLLPVPSLLLLALGLFYLGAAWFAWQGSRLACLVGSIVYSADTALTLVFLVPAWMFRPGLMLTFWIVVRVAMLGGIWHAWRRMPET